MYRRKEEKNAYEQFQIEVSGYHEKEVRPAVFTPQISNHTHTIPPHFKL